MLRWIAQRTAPVRTTAPQLTVKRAGSSIAAIAPRCLLHSLASSRAALTPISSSIRLLSITPTTLASSPVRSFSSRETRRKAAPRSRKVLPITLPPYISSVALAKILGTTLRRLAKEAARTFPEWWPKLTRRGMKKDGFSELKEMVFEYEEAERLSKVCRRSATKRDLDAEHAEWSLTRPFGPASIQSRPPVISILGHKDHGKTTLLDRLRGGKVAESEEFGITQETYAFNVHLSDPASPSQLHRFSFLDTPGHVSFTEMRQNVAGVSDLLLLVVAADEGVLDQTFETLRTARQTGRPLIVVINKIDLPDAAANVKKIRDELVNLGATLHSPKKPKVSLTGDLVVVELSALYDTTGFSELRQVLLSLTRDYLKPQADVNAVPAGTVLESYPARGRGNVLRLILHRGTLRVGQAFCAEGVFEGRVKEIRAMKGNEEGGAGGGGEEESLRLTEVSPGIPVDITGCIALPSPGSPLLVHSTWDAAKLYAETRRNEVRWRDQRREGRGAGEEREGAPQEDQADEEHAEEEEYDEIEEVDELDPKRADEGDADAEGGEFDPTNDVDDSTPIPAEDIPIDLDPRGRLAPPLPPRSTWELSPPPPPQQRALPLAGLRPKFRFYSLVEGGGGGAGRSGEQDSEVQARNAAASIESPPSAESGRRFGLNILLKTQNMGAMTMLRQAIDDMNVRNEERGLPAVHVAYAAAGDLTKKDLINAEAEGCWVYGFRIARPGAPALQQARSRHVPLFAFRHHQHLLDHLQTHLEQSPRLTETGEADLS